MSILAELKDRFRTALTGMVDEPEPLLGMIRSTQDPKFGDYQANFAMSLKNQLGKSPREIAADVVEALDVSDMCHDPEIAGPGFINLKLRDDWISQQLGVALLDDRLGIGQTGQPRTVVVDYSSPNVAKPMHVGHIRSTVIGDSIARTLRFLGHQVITDNHLGDWGTQFGMIIYGYKNFRDDAAYASEPVAELGRLYKLVNQLIEYHAAKKAIPELLQRVSDCEQRWQAEQNTELPEEKAARKAAKKRRNDLQTQLNAARDLLTAANQKIDALEQDSKLAEVAAGQADIGEAALRETAKLHADDAENLALWNEFLPKCRNEIQHIYQRLDVHFDYEYGESYYHHMLEDIVTDFRSRELARESEGAMCVFLAGFDAPMIIQKRDGAFLYATTDLATIRFRMQEWKADAILYVVDHRQGEHFDKLFAATRLWGYEQVDLRHISFGTVLGKDGRPYKTRSGDAEGLESLLDEAVNRAHAVVSKNDDDKPGGAELDADERKQIADVVGHAAIKYADLSQNRTSDYKFSYDKMVSMEGNTATYMQYSYARTQSIFAKGNVDIAALRNSAPPISIEHEAERALALEILRLAEAIEESVVDYRPNLLTTYLFDLAKRFSQFFDRCKVLKAESDELRESRLRLCDLTGRTIRLGLQLLGIDVVNRM